MRKDRILKKGLKKLKINLNDFESIVHNYPFLLSEKVKSAVYMEAVDALKIIEENIEEITEAIQDSKYFREIKKELVSLAKERFILSNFIEVNSKNMWNDFLKESLSLFEPIKYEKEEIIQLFEHIENSQIKEIFMTKYFEELLNKRKVLKYYPPYVDKKEMTKEIKTLLKEAIHRKSFKIDLTDIYDKYNEESCKKKEEKLKEEKLLRAKASLTDIEKFFYQAREIKRRVIAHLGPTNSGKTYNAIKEFQEAETGIYLAPLRLLAREIYDECSFLNISLITGEERIISENETHVSSTIEMANFDKEYDIAIIDEIQLIEDSKRGAAWTRALMGIKAKKVYVIGSDNTESIIRKIITKCGDTLEIKRHERLSELKVIKEPLTINDLEEGDAVICFSRNDIYNMKEQIEETGKSTALVYGSLPPSTRLKQAEQFNNKERDILIATDAIGLGLNLNIKRIIFSSLVKYDGYEEGYIDHSLFKQIAGRAGRYGLYEYGEVGVLEGNSIKEFKNLALSFKEKLEDIETAMFFPEFEHIKEFSKSKEYNNLLSEIIKDYSYFFNDKEELFEMIDIEEFYETAKLIDKTANIKLKDKYSLAFAPMPKRSYLSEMILQMFIEYIQGGNLVKFENYYDLKKIKKMYLNELEDMHKHLSLYMWLGYRLNIEESYQEELLNLYEKIANQITGRIY